MPVRRHVYFEFLAGAGSGDIGKLDLNSISSLLRSSWITLAKSRTISDSPSSG